MVDSNFLDWSFVLEESHEFIYFVVMFRYVFNVDTVFTFTLDTRRLRLVCATVTAAKDGRVGAHRGGRNRRWRSVVGFLRGGRRGRRDEVSASE